jgi:hypothetical protein
MFVIRCNKVITIHYFTVRKLIFLYYELNITYLRSLLTSLQDQTQYHFLYKLLSVLQFIESDPKTDDFRHKTCVLLLPYYCNNFPLKKRFESH